MHLRVTLDREVLLDQTGPRCGFFPIYVHFAPDTTPGLEVLELDVQGGLSVSIDPLLPLKSLVLIAAGELRLSEPVWCKAPRTPLKEMYLHSGTPCHEAAFDGSCVKGSWAGLLKDYIRQEQGHWTACMPATFLSVAVAHVSGALCELVSLLIVNKDGLVIALRSTKDNIGSEEP